MNRSDIMLNNKKIVKTIDKADGRLIDLAFYALEEGINIKRTGTGFLVPFVITEYKAQRQLKKFDAPRTDIGVGEGMDYLKQVTDINFAVIVFDGYLSVNGKRDEAVIVRGYDRVEEVGYLIGQRYSPLKFLSSFKLIGNPGFLGNEEQALR